MSNYRSALLAALLAVAFSHSSAPLVEDDPVVGDPLKGVVLGEELVNCVLSRGKMVEVYAHPLGQDRKTTGRVCAWSNISPVRWQLSHGAFWVIEGCGMSVPAYLRQVWGGPLERIGLATFSDKKEDLYFCPDRDFTREDPASLLVKTVHSNDKFLYMDYLPAGMCRARQFFATNLPGTWEDRDRDPAEVAKAPRVFSCYVGESRWDAKEGVWKPVPWKHEWTIPAAFKEPFQALALGDDFYFVTRSGALFCAAKPAKGTDRTLARVWDGKQPIRSFITDAATNKTFLFVPPAKAGGKPAFFELSDKPKLVEYDPKAVPLPKLDEPHRTILHNARILVALKKIKGEPSPEPGGK